MASETVFAGLRQNDSMLKREQSIKLKVKLFELEQEYRQRLSTFVKKFKDAAKQSQCLTQTRIKTISKIFDEVVKGSDGLLVTFDKREGYQPADALYEQITTHRRQWADDLYTYCAQLQDICNLLQESCPPGKVKTGGGGLHSALLPVHHVQELLDIFQEVKKDLIENRRLVEVFSCNTLIEQLNKELERMRKVITSINGESLLVELFAMATNYNRGDGNIEAVTPATGMETRPDLLEMSAAQQTHKKKDPDPETLSMKGIQKYQEAETHEASSISESSQKEESGDVKIKITRFSKIPLSRRESKKLVRYQVQSFASKLSEMKDELFFLEQKLEDLKMLSIDSSSESENDSTTGDSDGKNSMAYEDTVHGVQRVEVRRTPFSRIKDSQTKALLRSSMRRAPLYQNNQKFVSHLPDSSPVTKSSAVGDLPEMMKDNISATRPESGIVMEEGFHNDSNENTASDGTKHDESYYVTMNGADLKNKSQNLREVDYSNGLLHLRTYSLQVSNSDNESVIYQNYANMSMTPMTQDQSERCHLTIQDDKSTDQPKMLPTSEEFLEELPSSEAPKYTRQRTGWCQIPLVKESGVLESMTSKQRNLQEAKYEIISSKVLYLKSLSIVQSVFIENEELRNLITPTEWNDLFQLIGPIKQCSEHFLSDLLSGWPKDIFLSNQLSVVRQYAESGLQVYVDFCSHKITMDDTLKNIRANNPRASMALKKLENEEICDGHDLESFLVLPIQRITRFPLLVEGILLRMDINNDKDFCDWAKTYHKLRMMAKSCNDAVRDAETQKISSNCLRSPSSTLPSKKNKMSSLWNDQH